MIEPENQQLSPESRQRILEIKQLYPSARSAILPALHVVQDQFGWVPSQAMVEVAEILGMFPADVNQVVTFYRMYNQKPVGSFVVKVCDSISCFIRGSDDLIARGERKLALRCGQTTPDGKLTLARIECLAACGNAPVIQVNDEYLYDVSPEQFEAVLEELGTAKQNPYFVP